MITEINLTKMSKTSREVFLYLQGIDRLLQEKSSEIDRSSDRCYNCEIGLFIGECGYTTCEINLHENEEITRILRNIRNCIDKQCEELYKDAIIDRF